MYFFSFLLVLTIYNLFDKGNQFSHTDLIVLDLPAISRVPQLILFLIMSLIIKDITYVKPGKIIISNTKYKEQVIIESRTSIFPRTFLSNFYSIGLSIYPFSLS